MGREKAVGRRMEMTEWVYGRKGWREEGKERISKMGRKKGVNEGEGKIWKGRGEEVNEKKSHLGGCRH